MSNPPKTSSGQVIQVTGETVTVRWLNGKTTTKTKAQWKALGVKVIKDGG